MAATMGQHIDRKDLALFQFVWINAKEVLPNEDYEEVFVLTQSGNLMVLHYNAQYKMFNVTDNPQTQIKVLAYALPTKKFLDFRRKLEQERIFKSN